VSEALLDKEKFGEMFCNGTFWYFWTMDKLREILGENKRREVLFTKENEIQELRELQRNLERKLVHLKSEHECRSMMIEALRTEGKQKTRKKIKKEKEIGLVLKEDAGKKIQYMETFVEFRGISRSLGDLEMEKLTKLQSLIPSRYNEEGGIDMDEDIRIGEIMKIIMNSWKDVGGSGLKYVNREKCLDVILNTTFLAINDKFVYQEDVPRGTQRIQLIRSMKENVWCWYKWRKKRLKSSEMWERCCKFERDMEEAGIKGRSMSGTFEVSMFEKEIWSFYDVETWFQDEKGRRRFMFDGEESLDVEDLLGQLKSKKGRLKEKKRKGRKKKPPDKDGLEKLEVKGRNKSPRIR
jgi:hypothetical protein